MRLTHAGGHTRPGIVVHGSQLTRVAESYERYLNTFFRKEVHLVGTPIRFDWKEGGHPSKNKRKIVTPLGEYELRIKNTNTKRR